MRYVTAAASALARDASKKSVINAAYASFSMPWFTVSRDLTAKNASNEKMRPKRRKNATFSANHQCLSACPR